MIEKLDAIPEIIVIDGDFGDGKTCLAVQLLNMMIEKDDKVYSNTTLKIKNFDNVKEYFHIKKLSWATFLQMNNGIGLIDELLKVFDKRESIENTKKTQAIQEIRKHAYKIIGTVSDAQMLDFRYLQCTTHIIKAWGNLDRIIKKEYYKSIPINILESLSSNNEVDLDFIFLYEWCTYDKQHSDRYNCHIQRLGEYFTYDIRNSFDLYSTHENIQKTSFLNDFMEKNTK